MTRRYVAARRHANRELAERDARNRCHVCKKSLVGVQPIYEALGMIEKRRFCRPECRDSYLGIEQPKGVKE